MPQVKKSNFPGPDLAGRIAPEGLASKLGFQSNAEATVRTGAAVFTLDRMPVSDLAPAPIRPEWILEGTPHAMCRQLSGLSDRRGDICHWSCTAGRFRWHYAMDEAVMFLEGRVEITDHNGNTYVGEPGVNLFFPAGTVAEWHVPSYIRKIAFNHNPVPRYFRLAARIADKTRTVISRLRK
ncbi:MAG: cupin domain-containing protein [Roseibium sp.]